MFTDRVKNQNKTLKFDRTQNFQLTTRTEIPTFAQICLNMGLISQGMFMSFNLQELPSLIVAYTFLNLFSVVTKYGPLKTFFFERNTQITYLIISFICILNMWTNFQTFRDVH